MVQVCQKRNGPSMVGLPCEQQNLNVCVDACLTCVWKDESVKSGSSASARVSRMIVPLSRVGLSLRPEGLEGLERTYHSAISDPGQKRKVMCVVVVNKTHQRLLHPTHPTSMGNTNSVPSTSQRQIPKIKFRVLIIGRANAGKTSILQRVCDTTDSPVVYRGDEEVRSLTFVTRSIRSYSIQDST